MRLPYRLIPAASLLVVAYAHAQTAANPSTSLDTITVYGNADHGYVGQRVGVGAFRDQSIMDVPATVNVATRDLIETQAAVTLYDVLRNTAGVTRQQLGGETLDNLAVRGMILDNRSNYRLNGSLPLLNLMQLPLEDKERIEVLKGVSALYYGYTAPGGVVNMVTKRAGNAPNTRVGISTDNNGTIVGNVDVGRRFGSEQQYGLRVNAAGGSLQSPVRGIDGERKMISAAFDWRVNERMNIRLDGEYFQRTIAEQSVVTLPAAKNGVIAIPRVPDPSNRLSPEWANFAAHGNNLLFHTDYALSDRWIATFEAGQAKLTRDERSFTEVKGYDLVTGQGTISGNRQRDVSWTNRNLRAELFGSFATGSIGHELTIGAAQTRSDQSPTYTGLFSGSQNLYNPVDLPWLATTRTTYTAPLAAVDKGIYATDRIALTDKWQAILGARYTKYTSDQGANHYKASKTTPLTALIYKFSPQLMAYASYATGIEQGDRAPNTATNVNEALPPGISKQKEAGLRWQPTQTTLLSIAAFDINRAASYVNSDNLFVQSGRERYRGIEWSAQGQVSRDWSVQVSGQYLHARFESISAELLGRTPENTPTYTGSVFAQYTVPMLPKLSLNAGVYYTGRRAVNDLDQGYLPHFTLIGLGGRYVTTIDRKNVTWQVNVDNVMNKRYWAAAGNNRLGMGQPRTAKLSVQLDL
ncbi:iron complex outermembrane receptor protein [Luteibacter rhizovicinus]|uniref:Iron complex outermembrane receptor protein n=1 Tax=Luteibacter rhizovicinus TaxID=242606 RepID=A0A4R3YPQ0_9GAMM|nr:TonB-dependent siderophore receptor [Luteibacter rhizovicinus]TCV92893.1 iron complex outermembrane receptor protein [Luteibacter rhizovicinus]